MPTPVADDGPRPAAAPVPTPILREAVGQVVPDGFVHDVVQSHVVVARPVERVWAWLDDPATFVDGQVWPYAVEFHHPPHTAAFRPGVRNDHHGPGLHLPAVVGAVHPPRHRELVYLYGAYVASPRLVRPVRLAFDLQTDPAGGRTRITVTAEAVVRTPLVAAWRVGNGVFWRRFGRWCAAATSTR